MYQVQGPNCLFPRNKLNGKKESHKMETWTPAHATGRRAESPWLARGASTWKAHCARSKDSRPGWIPGRKWQSWGLSWPENFVEEEEEEEEGGAAAMFLCLVILFK